MSQYASGTLRERWSVRDATSLIATFKYARSVTHPTKKYVRAWNYTTQLASDKLIRSASGTLRDRTTPIYHPGK